jgi:hypothetical protein
MLKLVITDKINILNEYASYKNEFTNCILLQILPIDCSIS